MKVNGEWSRLEIIHGSPTAKGMNKADVPRTQVTTRRLTTPTTANDSSSSTFLVLLLFLTSHGSTQVSLGYSLQAPNSRGTGFLVLRVTVSLWNTTQFLCFPTSTSSAHCHVWGGMRFQSPLPLGCCGPLYTLEVMILGHIKLGDVPE